MVDHDVPRSLSIDTAVVDAHMYTEYWDFALSISTHWDFNRVAEINLAKNVIVSLLKILFFDSKSI